MKTMHRIYVASNCKFLQSKDELIRAIQTLPVDASEIKLDTHFVEFKSELLGEKTMSLTIKEKTQLTLEPSSLK